MLVSLGFPLPSSFAGATSIAAPKFELPRWPSGESIKLSELTGQIVVLDFFAYWCGPCKKASQDLEVGIQRYYAAQKGNRYGTPVRVISVNIEQDHPELTADFVREVGVEWVVMDQGSTLLGQLGGAATPFVVIIDGTRATLESPEFDIVYRQDGFDGIRKLREVIDAIKPPNGNPQTASASSVSNDAKPPRLPLTRKAEVSFDALLSSDARITATTLGYGEKRGKTEWSLSYTHQTYGLNYEPFTDFDFLGFSEHVNATYNGGQASVRQPLSKTLTVIASGGVYSGYTDYRSLWLANYYKQQFDFVPGYEIPRPQGFNASTGLRWEYQPTTGFIEAGFLYANSQIAPGYELDPLTSDLVRGRQILHTYAPSLKFENVLTRRIRTLNEFQLTTTTGRKARYGYRGSINVAVAERWVWRTSGGYTHEDPTVRAWFAGATLEFAITPRWFVNVSGLYYRDSGEIENSLFISTAAPGLRTYQAGLGLRYAWNGSSFSLSASPVRAKYDEVELGTKPFSNLYRDRAWLAVQAAWNVEF